MSVSMMIDRGRLLSVSAQLMDGHVSYGWGAKAQLGEDPASIHQIDCSGFVRYLLYQATGGALILPDGSWHQDHWCVHQNLERVSYSTASSQDGWLRIAFIPPSGANHLQHVWLVLDGRTLESHGHKGPDRRPWNTSILVQHVRHTYKLAQTFVLGDFEPASFAGAPAAALV